MGFEQFFLVFSTLLLFFDLLFLVKMKSGDKKRIRWGFWFSIAAFVLIAIGYSMYLEAFLTNNFAVKEVYSSSSTSLSVGEKIYASWSGAGGSILLLVLIISTLYLVLRSFAFKKNDTLSVGTSKILNITLLFFLIVGIAKNPFSRFASIPIEGRGLNPALQSPWMAVHPPIVFGGYVFVLLAFALVLAKITTKESGQEKLLRISTYAAWLLLTVGIALGGLWAYEVLGWGGYWSWDPVETGSLLAWLALTAYFLLDPITKQGKGLAKELMILVTFASLIFLSALTRGGLTQSVHAYALSPAGPILLIFAVVMGAYFFYLKRKSHKPLFMLEIDKSSVASISHLIAFSSLLLIFFVSFFGVAAPIVQSIFASSVPTPSVDFYNNWNFPFVLIFVASLIGLTLPKRVSVKVFIALIGVTFLAGLILSFLKTPTSSNLANAGLPILLLGFSVISYRLLFMLIKKKRSPHQLGKALVLAGIFLTLVGVLISAGGKQTSQFSSLTSGSSINAVGVQIQFQNFTVYQGTGNIQLQDGLYSEKSSLKIDAKLNNGGTFYDSSIWVELYPAYGIFSKPTIIRTATGDLYLHIEETDSISKCLTNSLIGQSSPPEDFDFTVDQVPFIYILWIGVGLMVLGITILLIAEFLNSKPKN